MEKYNPDNVLDTDQVAHIKQKAKAHGPGLMQVYMSEIMALTDTVQALQTRLALVEGAARELLEQGPFAVSEHAEWACCGRKWNWAKEGETHDPGCPYIALKQALEGAGQGQVHPYNSIVAAAHGLLQERHKHPSRDVRWDILERACDEATPEWRTTLEAK